MQKTMLFADYARMEYKSAVHQMVDLGFCMKNLSRLVGLIASKYKKKSRLLI